MKEHYTNLHWGDWFKDTACLRSSTRGIWLDMIGEMARRGTDRIHAQFERLPFVLRDTPTCIMQAAIELAENDTAEVFVDGVPLLEWRQKLSANGLSELDWITNQMAKAYLTVICRRRSKELEISKKRSEAGKKGMASRYQEDNKPPNKEPNKDVTNAGIGIGNGNGVVMLGGSPEGGAGPVETVIHHGAPFKRADFDTAAKQLTVPDSERDGCWAYLESQSWKWANGRHCGQFPRSVLQRWMSMKDRLPAKTAPTAAGAGGNGHRQRWQIEADIESVKKHRAKVRERHSETKNFQTTLTPDGRAMMDKLNERLKELEAELLHA